ncbi:biological_process [Nesidiocoris tenuis]|uniref:Biological_process n=1 Tax=Nesidiocoris tenuis TaxID=355587 RepID=A0ABN7AF79_9HEMI|nr:biological_process [Nesidiocoris tenuis]
MAVVDGVPTDKTMQFVMMIINHAKRSDRRSSSANTILRWTLPLSSSHLNMRATYSIALAVAAVLLVDVAEGYSKGAPKEVCDDMTPQHPATPQPKNTSPYLIKMNRNKIQAGESVNVTITGKKGETIKGFMIQARVGSTPVGHFSSGKDVQTVDCGSGRQNSATHTNSEAKKEIRATWTAPANLKETVYMYATVAKDGGTFWVQQKSRGLTVE